MTPRLLAVLASILVVLSPSPAAADAPDAAPAPVAPRAAPALADVAWLAGAWRGESKGTRQEEVWLPPDGGLMLGLHRDVGASGRASFEYLRIEQHADGVVYQASPGGAPPTPFRLVEAGPARAVFTNPEHDFPKRILYSLAGDVLTARIEGDGGMAMEWKWRRAAGP